MKPTIAEQEGLVDREQLCDIAGRGRKPQMALARELGLTEYPNAAGGCLLTEPLYSHRLRELLDHVPDPSLRDLHLLRVGRHFRLPSGEKVIVGRDERENERLETFVEKGDYKMWVDGFGSPLTFLFSTAGEDDIETAARFCARYSSARKLPEVEVTVSRDGEERKITVSPADEALLDSLRIHQEGPGKKKKKKERASAKAL
jgi:hypothetical protein